MSEIHFHHEITQIDNAELWLLVTHVKGAEKMQHCDIYMSEDDALDSRNTHERIIKSKILEIAD